MKKFALFACFALLVTAAAAWAEKMPDGYPKAPIQLIVCYSPGAATDFQARIVSMPAGENKYFGEPIVIVNKAGAGGMTGWNWVAESGSKDGLTMTAYNLPHIVAQALVQKPKFTADSFEPLANWGSDPAVLVVAMDSPHKTVDDLVKFAKANPKKLTINGAGLYVGHHIATLQLQKAAKIEMTYVPEQGAADALRALYGKTVLSGFTNLADAYRAQDRLRILAIADIKRHEYLPNVPTFKELGYDIDNASVNFRGFAFPAGVPKEVIEHAAKVVPAMFNDPIVASKMKESGSPLHILSREEVQKLIANQKAVLSELLAPYIK
ncbi:MAG: tripartite tricarboxylate transporter substrate binding protein [Deltaproteobacteria bacterium]|jgi:tripartite-type tricarboxylate transporter receptor subunit TctC|nr:tripartite tricarboxylate transporter substrate binding protein [Deltaproteobacteria bacterium]